MPVERRLSSAIGIAYDNGMQATRECVTEGHSAVCGGRKHRNQN